MNSCKKTKNKIILLAVVPLFLTLGGIILRMVNLISFYDSAIGYYEKAALPTVMNIFFIVSIIVFASVCFFSEKKNIISESFANTSFFKVVCVICSIAMAVCALNCFSDNSKALLAILVPIASVCSVIFFVLFLLKKQPDYSAIFALFPVALCAMILAVTYFDVKVEMNSPNKMLIHFACIASMLAFVSEARLLADNKKRKTYFFFLASALFLTGVSSIPSIVLYFSNTFTYTYVKYDCILLVLFVYFVGRLLTLLSDCAPCSCEPNTDDTQTE